MLTGAELSDVESLVLVARTVVAVFNIRSTRICRRSIRRTGVRGDILGTGVCRTTRGTRGYSGIRGARGCGVI